MNKDDIMLLIESISSVLPSRLKDFREKSNLSLRDVAFKINKSPSQISLWEKGVNPPSCIDLFKLCLVYDIMLSDLFPEFCEGNKPIRDFGFYKKYIKAPEEVKITIQKILEYTVK